MNKNVSLPSTRLEHDRHLVGASCLAMSNPIDSHPHIIFLEPFRFVEYLL